MGLSDKILGIFAVAGSGLSAGFCWWCYLEDDGMLCLLLSFFNVVQACFVLFILIKWWRE